MDLPENRFSGLIPATFGAVVNSSCPLLELIGKFSPVSGAASAAAILIVTVALPGFFYLKKNKNKLPTDRHNVRGESTDASVFDPLLDEFVGERISEIVVDSDAEYAEELQLHEALVASLYTAQSSNYASVSAQGLLSETEMLKLEKEGDDQLNNFCQICLDNKESWEMFENDSCSHSFCYECTSKHIMTRISQKAKVIGCPGVSCGAAFDVTACRFMIPKEARIEWDESICQSMILDSQKLYCPFRDCSALLVNDSGAASIGKMKCPLCKRSFCAACRVPWHPEFTCKEFQKLNAKKGSKGEDMVKTLAKKKNWQKCPNCKIYVEKTEGCIHMTCRCEYEFCYRCGAKWTGSHACRKK